MDGKIRGFELFEKDSTTHTLKGGLLDNHGELWMRQKPNEEVEEDYFRLFRVGLKLSD